MGIVEFLKARIAEDEADARAADEGRLLTWSKNDHMVIVDSGFMQTFTPSRILREVAAKRSVIGKYLWADRVRVQMEEDDDDVKWEWIFKSEALVEVLRALASAYADHPDFNEEWRP